MKKVLFVANTMQMGGAERILYNILKNIDKEKFDISVLALVDFGVLADKIKRIPGIKYFSGYTGLSEQKELNDNVEKLLKECQKRYKNSTSELYDEIIGNRRYDVIVSFLEGRVAKFTSFCNDDNTYKIVWIHTALTDQICKENFLSKDDEHNSYSRYDKVVCVSKEVKDAFIKQTGINKNVMVQYNPVNLKRILDLSLEKSQEIEKQKNCKEPIVCAVGRLDSVKGYDRLLEAHKRLLTSGVKHKLWIVGEGQERENIENFINDNRLNDSVILWGYQANPYKFLKNADIYVCSSYSEGLSNTVIEAATLGKVIVTTNCAGMSEILGEDNEKGLIVENSTDGIEKGLSLVLQNDTLRKKYEQNIKGVGKKFELENTIMQIEEMLNKATNI